MKVSVLVSTMNDNIAIVERMNIKGDATIINQTDYNYLEKIPTDTGEVYFKSCTDRGLSKSRNLAIKLTNADICLLADDDTSLEDNYDEIIREAYTKYPDADIIAFRVDSKDEKRQLNRLKEGRVNRLFSMKIASVQISFKKDSIVDKKLKFDERFGAGSGQYTNGEENIFLYKAIKSGLKMYYYDKKIGIISGGDSTWYGKNVDQDLKSKGAMFKEMSNYLYPLLILQYVVRKKNEFLNHSVIDMLRLCFEGAKEN